MPAQPNLAVVGKPQPVVASRSERGVQREFLEGIVLVRPKDAAELKAFVDRTGGTVVGDDTIPQAPPEADIVLTDAQRAPTQWAVAIDPSKADVVAMTANAAKVDLVGRVAFSSDRALRTFATLLDAKAAGFRVSISYIDRGTQGFPMALSRRGRAGRPARRSASTIRSRSRDDYGNVGNQSNVTLAWQFVAAHGIARRTKVAIIDGGF